MKARRDQSDATSGSVSDDVSGASVEQDLGERVRYGTRWGVFGLALAPTVALLIGLGTVFGTGALALSFVAHAGTLELRTAGLAGDDLGVVVAPVRTQAADGQIRSVPGARIGVGKARINGLCLAHEVTLLGKPFTLLIQGGDTDPATFEIGVDGLVLDVTSVRAAIGGGGEVQVNKSAANVRVPAAGSLDGAADSFGLQASSARLSGVQATVRDIVIPDLLNVPDFRISVAAGARGCPTSP